MENLEGLLRLVDKEFGEMAQNGKFRTPDDVELAYKLVDIAKDIYCIWKYEDRIEDDEYSEFGRYPYENGNSYARGRGMKRNSMGQFTSRDGNMNYRGNGTSYNYRPVRGGMSSRGSAKEEYIENLREMMMNAPDAKTADHIQRMIDEMEQ